MTLVLKATGETAELIVNAIQSGGAKVEFITSLPPGADGPPLHIHARQSERFEVIEGELLLHVNRETVLLQAGQEYLVPPGTPHRFENPGLDTARWHVRVEPALNFDYLAEAMIELANLAYPEAPRPEQLAYILDQVSGEYYLADKPMAEQDEATRRLAAHAITEGLLSLSEYRQRQREDDAAR